MKAYLQQLCSDVDSPLIGRHLVREYLQARILQSLQRAKAMQALAFHGGTALRFLYQIPRYSEDLDFALERAPEAYDFRAYLRQIERDFLAETYTLDFKVNEKRVVHKAFVRFRGLLYELGLSDRQPEVLAVKIEIDTNPPPGAILDTTILQNNHVALNIQHHDRSTLLAGKLLAVLQRSYAKGRDIFDLWWYLSQPEWPEPNLKMMNHDLAKFEWSGPPLDEDNWRHYVRARVEQLDWEKDVLQDIQAFIIDPDHEEYLNKDSLLQLLSSE